MSGNKSGKSPKKNRKKCPHCSSGSEVFRYLKKKYVFDVDLAREIVSDGRDATEVDEASVKWCVDTTRLYEEHINHVDTRFPGIIAYVFHPLPDGTEAHGHLLIDGNHRAARCLQLGIPFHAYIMSEEESRRILLEYPQPPAEMLEAAVTAS